MNADNWDEGVLVILLVLIALVMSVIIYQIQMAV